MKSEVRSNPQPAIGHTADLMRILVVGASGYVGGRLVPLLAQHGHELILLSRSPRVLAERFPNAKVVAGDLLDPGSLDSALHGLHGIDVAYYLAHSMAAGEAGFAARDRAAARHFAEAAARVGVGRIVYLGGLGDDSPELSHHLASRHEVGSELAAHGVPATEFRAAVVIGSGSASFEMLRDLTERLPVMITPRWVSTRCQPIGIRDLLAYLLAALEHPEVTGIVEIGGPDVVSYGEMMLIYARLRGLRRLMIPVPVLTPRLSSYWVGLVSPIPAGIARPLIEGLRNEVVVRNPGPARAFGIQTLPYEAALRQAIDRTEGDPTATTWFDAISRRDLVDLPAAESREGMIIDRQSAFVDAPPEQVFKVIERVGGKGGWPYANLLWGARGLIDRAVGGVGMRLGRRDPDSLRTGDALDFWRVEQVDRPRLLRLRAEMKVPGRAWLQFEVLPRGSGSELLQTAFFEPKGLPGLAYWYGLYPVHRLVFRGTVRVLAERAAAERQDPAPVPM